MNEENGFDKVARGDRAKEMLESPVFQDALSEVREAIFRSWESLPTDADDKLRDLKLSIHLLNAIVKNLQTFIEEGALEKFETEQQDKLKENKRWL